MPQSRFPPDCVSPGKKNAPGEDHRTAREFWKHSNLGWAGEEGRIALDGAWSEPAEGQLS